MNPGRTIAIRTGRVVAFGDHRHRLLWDRGHRLLRGGNDVIAGYLIVRADPTPPAGERVAIHDRMLTAGLLPSRAHLSSPSLDRSFLQGRDRPSS